MGCDAGGFGLGTHQAVDSAVNVSRLWELPDTGHVGGLFAHPEEYGRRMVSFFDAALLAGGP